MLCGKKQLRPGLIKPVFENDLRISREPPLSRCSRTTKSICILPSVAQRCQAFEYEQKNKTRTRDAELSRRDRVELMLDVDRDRRTYYRLAVDSRGFCHDSLWGDATWDPRWYVARRRR